MKRAADVLIALCTLVVLSPVPAVSLTGAREKLAQMDEISDRRVIAVNLGIRTFSQAASRIATTGISSREVEDT